jgi:hypothetical protein
MNERKQELANRAAESVTAAYQLGFRAGIEHVTGLISKRLTPASLLRRFVEIYGDVPLVGSSIDPGRQLWRDYYEWSGEHMILTEDGWESAESKQSYEALAASQGVPLSDFIQDEVNAPQVTRVEV